MAIGWMIKVDVTGDGYKDSVRGYAVAIRNRDEAMAAAREASGERVVEVDGEMTRETLRVFEGSVSTAPQREPDPRE